MPVVGVPLLQRGERPLHPRHRPVQRPRVPRIGHTAALHRQPLRIPDREPGPLHLRLRVPRDRLQPRQPVLRGRHRLVGRVQRTPDRLDQRPDVRPTLLLPRPRGLPQLLLGPRHVPYGLVRHLLQVLPARGTEPPAQLTEDRIDPVRPVAQRLRAGPQAHQAPVDLRGPLREPRDLGPYGLRVPQDPVRALDGLLHPVLRGALVQQGQLRPQRGQPRSELVGPHPLAAHVVQRRARREQRGPGPLPGGRHPRQLRLGLVQQRLQPLREPVELALDPHELVPRPRQLLPRPGGDGPLEVHPVKVVRVDGLDVHMADLVDPLSERGEPLPGLPRRGRPVGGRDGLHGDPQIPLGGVQLVERGRGSILRRLRIRPPTLVPPAEPPPGCRRHNPSPVPPPPCPGPFSPTDAGLRGGCGCHVGCPLIHGCVAQG